MSLNTPDFFSGNSSERRSKFSPKSLPSKRFRSNRILDHLGLPKKADVQWNTRDVFGLDSKLRRTAFFSRTLDISGLEAPPLCCKCCHWVQWLAALHATSLMWCGKDAPHVLMWKPCRAESLHTLGVAPVIAWEDVDRGESIDSVYTAGPLVVGVWTLAGGKFGQHVLAALIIF